VLVNNTATAMRMAMNANMLNQACHPVKRNGLACSAYAMIYLIWPFGEKAIQVGLASCCKSFQLSLREHGQIDN